MWRLFLLALCTTFFALSLSIVGDRVAGIILNKSGYFTAMRPRVSIHFDTMEFDAAATVSRQGLRNVLVATPKPSNVFRFLAIGDSFTFGWGVGDQESWPFLLEQSFKEKGYAVEVINAGAPGLSFMEYRWICEAYAARMDVDAVIIGLSLDDFYQTGARAVQIPRMSRFVDVFWPTLRRIRRPVIAGEWYLQHRDGRVDREIQTSVVWRQKVQDDLRHLPTLLTTIDPSLRTPYLEGRLSPTQPTRAALDPSYFSVLTGDRVFSDSLKAIDGELVKMARCTNGKPVIVLLLPQGIIVSQEYQDASRKLGYEVTPSMLTFDFATPLQSIVEKHGWTFTSALEDFRGDGCPDCFYPYDEHLTPVGQSRLETLIAPSVSSVVLAR